MPDRLGLTRHSLLLGELPSNAPSAGRPTPIVGSAAGCVHGRIAGAKLLVAAQPDVTPLLDLASGVRSAADVALLITRHRAHPVRNRRVNIGTRLLPSRDVIRLRADEFPRVRVRMLVRPVARCVLLFIPVVRQGMTSWLAVGHDIPGCPGTVPSYVSSGA